MTVINEQDAREQEWQAAQRNREKLSQADFEEMILHSPEYRVGIGTDNEETYENYRLRMKLRKLLTQERRSGYRINEERERVLHQLKTGMYTPAK